jgi:hypothetical protein
MPAGFEQLTVQRVNRRLNALQDVRDMPQELKFLKRTPMVPALDNEIMARFVGRAQIADLVADDGVAAVYSLGKFSTYTHEPPNIKVGTNFTQSELNQILAVSTEDAGLTDALINMRIDAVRIGVQQRIETMLVAMSLDTFTYNRLGVAISGASWGMPSQLKVTTATPVQANPTTATMTDEILSLKLVASTQFGIDYNRITMSTAGFRAWIATTEFQNRAKLELRSDIGYTNLSLYDLTKQRMLAQSVLGMEIEFYDARYWSATTAGVIASAPYWPLNKVMLSSTANDNNPMVQDFANGITTESRVMAGFGGGTNTMNAGVIGSFSGGMRGPVGYATLEGMNPPHVTMWNVARGWPRKHILYANAVYDMGTVTDPVSVTEPF